jgi:hypothetical protein
VGPGSEIRNWDSSKVIQNIVGKTSFLNIFKHICRNALLVHCEVIFVFSKKRVHLTTMWLFMGIKV